MAEAGFVQGFAFRERFVVVALLEPLGVGTTISRKTWPPHVTLASNFDVEVTAYDLALAVRRAGALDEPIVVQFVGSELFGPNRDVPVRLVQSEQVSALHHRLADQFEPMAGFVAEEPAYWRDGYRPHLTLTPVISIEDGGSRILRCVAVARLLEDDATVVAAFRLPGH